MMRLITQLPIRGLWRLTRGTIRSIQAQLRMAHRAGRSPNCQAALLALSAASLLYLNFDPVAADAQSIHTAGSLSNLPAVARRPNGMSSAERRTASLSSQADQPYLAGELRGDRALLLNMLLLERGYRRMSQVPSYTATFAKQERLDGDMGESQTMTLKLRHKPFSVYMKWSEGDVGRELLYVDGQNENRMLVRVGGIKGKLLPALKLDPSGDLALKEARYPVTKVGLLGLAGELLNYRRRDMKHPHAVCCSMLADAEFNGRACYQFLIEYRDRKVSELYRKSLVYLDQELSLPVFVCNYSWPAQAELELNGPQLDEATLLETYAYTNIQLDTQLADADFDRGNAAYRFSRR